MQSETDILEQLNMLRSAYGEEKFVQVLNGRRKERLYFFFITDTKGLMYHDGYGSAEPFTVEIEEKLFDVWTEGHFVHYDKAWEMWEEHFSNVAEQELLGDKNEFKLPEGFRDKMYEDVVDHLTEGKDYPGYAREISSYEADEMSDWDLYCTYHDIYFEDEELPEMVKIVEDILAKQELEEVINE